MADTSQPVEAARPADDEPPVRRSPPVALIVGVLVFGNALLWLLPSHVAELVARDHQVWLGRYSGGRFVGNLAALLGSAIVVFVALGGSPHIRRRRLFGSTVGVVVAALAVLGLDQALRFGFDWPYVLGEMAYRRPPNRTQTGIFEDKPLSALTYPNFKPGFGHVSWTLTTDAWGFRNARKLEAADVIALGDSFTEGSIVSDTDVWPAKLSEATDLAVCNLGMHGYAPQHSLAALTEYGLKLSPRFVILMFYEGNDFRSARLNAKPFPAWILHVKSEYSPLLRTVADRAHRAFGHWGASSARVRLDVLDWLPIGVPAGGAERYYAFPPSFLVEHFVTDEAFQRKSRWRRTKEVLTALQRTCQQANAELIVAYIPTKAHVVLPLAADRLPADKVRAFAMLQADDEELPPADQFLPALLNQLDVKEVALSAWCEGAGITFVSLTKPLRDATQRGEQAYYTYDDHWTPIGHELAATALATLLGAAESSGGR